MTRRKAIKTTGAALGGLLSVGVASNPAAARVDHATIQMEADDLTVTNQQSTRFGLTYIYVVRVKNHSGEKCRVEGYGHGPNDILVPRTIPGRSTGKFVFKVNRPLHRIVFTD